MIMQDENPAVDAPIPGQSLTAPLGDRPWQQPARYSAPEDALAYYVDKITNPQIANQMLNILELGVPISTLVDVMQTGGVMEGLHSVDVGVIISPALAETMEGMAKAAEIDYTVLGDEPENLSPKAAEVAIALEKAAKEKNAPQEMVQEEFPMDMPEEDKTKGLMARRIKDGV